jgi:hypothetical protein
MANNKHLISIINEEVDCLLKEIEYGVEDFINVNDINLQNEYDNLNQQLFNNKLPKVLLIWDNRKTALGHVRSIYNRKTGEQIIKHLAMSAFFKTTYNQFKNTLAHEMIHVEIISSGNRREFGSPHGFLFMYEANRINNKGLGFHITEINTEDIGMSDHALARTSAKTLIAMILEIDGKYYLNVSSPALFQTEGDIVFKLFEKLVNNGKYESVEITVIESRNPELSGERISRSFKRGITYSLLSDRLLEQLLNEKIIKSVKIKRNVPMEVSEDIKSPDNSNDWEIIDTV